MSDAEQGALAEHGRRHELLDVSRAGEREVGEIYVHESSSAIERDAQACGPMWIGAQIDPRSVRRPRREHDATVRHDKQEVVVAKRFLVVGKKWPVALVDRVEFPAGGGRRHRCAPEVDQRGNRIGHA